MREIEALKKAKEELWKNPDVTKLSIGLRLKSGAITDETCLVVGVAQKKPAVAVRADRMIPSRFNDMATDVQHGMVYAPRYPFVTKPTSLTAKRRPYDPGYSIGHYRITAGTGGFWAAQGADPERYIFSNNHVLADSNLALVNDPIRQPARYDGGTADDVLAWLYGWVKLNFDSDEPKKRISRLLWKIWKAPANALARAVGCPYRLEVRQSGSVDQPHPNLVDLAWAKPKGQSLVNENYPFNIGPLRGVRDLTLGDSVQKVGRTTEHTRGMVTGVMTMVKVQYGDGKVATFDDQIEIRGLNGNEFSAGGDSGSAILTDDAYLGGLLFAGGSGVTIASPIRHVLSLGSVRLPISML